MALRAQPPDLVVAFGHDIPGGAITIEVGMPLGRYLRIAGGQAILLIHLLARAIRAAARFRRGAISNPGLPFMALGAVPPGLAGGSCGDISGGEVIILAGVPLGRYLRIKGSEAIIRMHLPPCRKRGSPGAWAECDQQSWPPIHGPGGSATRPCGGFLR